MAISRILSGQFLSQDDHLSLPIRKRGTRAQSAIGTMMRRYPRIKRAGCPSSVLSCTAWGFSCLANCSASGELLPRLFTLARALLPKNRRCFFCDTLRHRNFSTAMPACFTRHAAVWCSDFPPTSPANAGLASDHLPSANNLSQQAEEENSEKQQSPKPRASCNKRRSFKAEMAPSKRKS
jgi:hypothetical protein